MTLRMSHRAISCWRRCACVRACFLSVFLVQWPEELVRARRSSLKGLL